NTAGLAEQYRVYICLTATAAAPPSNAWFAAAPANAPARAGLNTACFAELFRGYWNVMADVATAKTPVDNEIRTAINQAAGGDVDSQTAAPVPPGAYNDPYIGRKFADQGL